MTGIHANGDAWGVLAIFAVVMFLAFFGGRKK